ncbi:MAG: sugar-transfer associated ATP-grasp domain-containing protein [Saprospiraceae bacterium]|jgi:alpha-L-glutamate ligase-like protein|nr:sugar-transfer associated ATP-grasp domain-containing protein [Saprospiraceae bacterium]
MFSFLKRQKIEAEVLGINKRNIDFVYAKNPRKYFPLADDKVLCKEVLHQKNIACAETYGVIERIGDIQKVWINVEFHQKLAVKPANGSGGGGILILKKDKDGNWLSGGRVITEERIFSHFARIIMGMYSFGSSDRVLIEQCIEPHLFFAEIFPAGVPDFRVILLENEPIMSMLRVPTEKSDGKANLHQGGLGIGIDMKNGQLRQAYDGKNYHDRHPDNNNVISGKKIPYWETLLSLAIETSKAFPLDYLGIDIVLDKNFGPMIMEINVRPGLGIQLANKEGLWSVLKNF